MGRLGGAVALGFAGVLPDVDSYSRRTGTQLGFFITEPNRGDYVIKLKPRGQRRPIDEVMSDLRARIATTEPAIHTDFGQLLEDNIGDLTGGEPQPIDIKIYGEDQALLEQRAKQIAALISKVRGSRTSSTGSRSPDRPCRSTSTARKRPGPASRRKTSTPRWSRRSSAPSPTGSGWASGCTTCASSPGAEAISAAS